LEDKNCEIQNLQKCLNCKKEELCKVSKLLDERTNDCSLLTVANTKLEMDLKGKIKQLKDQNTRACNLEEKLNNERDALCNELKITRKKLSDIETQYEEVNCKINEYKLKNETLTTSLKELKDASEKYHYEMKCLARKLTEENFVIKDELCSMKNKNKKLQRENEFYVMEIKEFKNTIFDLECQLKRMKLLSEDTCIVKNKYEEFCCPELKTENRISSINDMTTNSNSDFCQTSKCINSSLQKCEKNCNVSNNNGFKIKLKDFQQELENIKMDLGQILN